MTSFSKKITYLTLLILKSFNQNYAALPQSNDIRGVKDSFVGLLSFISIDEFEQLKKTILASQQWQNAQTAYAQQKNDAFIAALKDLLSSTPISPQQLAHVIRSEGMNVSRMKNILLEALQQNVNLTVFQTLISAGANVNEQKQGLTPLFYAAKIDNIEAVKLLLQAGADPHLKTGNLLPVDIAHNKEIKSALKDAMVGARVEEPVKAWQ